MGNSLSRLCFPWFCLLAAFLLCSPNVAKAAEAKPLVLAFNTFSPWKTLDAQGQPAGPYTEIVKMLAQRLSARLVILPCPIQRCLQAMQQGQADVVIGVRNSADRDSYIDFIDPPYAPATPLAIYLRRNDSRHVQRYADLYALNLGVVEGVSYLPLLDHDKRIQRDFAPNSLSNFRKLLAGRVDAIIASRGNAEALILGQGWQNQLKRQPLLLDGQDERRLGLARHSVWYPQRARFSTILQSMLQDGSIARLLAAAAAY